MPCDPCVHTKTYELTRQARAQHLFNIYFYIMNIPMHQQCQTQLRISNANPNNSNKFAHAHKGRRKHIPLAHKTNSYIKRKFKEHKQTHPCTPGASRMCNPRASRGIAAPRAVRGRMRGSSASVHLRAVGGHVHVWHQFVSHCHVGLRAPSRHRRGLASTGAGIDVGLLRNFGSNDHRVRGILYFSFS